MENEIKTKGGFLDSIKLGDHVCSIYKNKEEQFLTAIPFLKNGHEKKERCIYIVDENSREEIISEFEKTGVDIKGCIESGAFKILTKKETYLKDGFFDPDKMIILLKETEKTALEEGYSGMRVAGEMTWVLEGVKGGERLIEYESKLNDFFPGSKSTALCQYNENKFTKDVLVEVIHTHPFLVIYGKLYENNLYFSPAVYKKGEHPLLPIDAYELIKNDIINS